MKPVMKNEKKYKLGIGKKIVAALIALGLVLGIGVGLVACNIDPVDQDQNPGIEQPGDPDDGKEDPDDGKEDPEDPGEPTDPDNPGDSTDPENPGEPEDPENPGEPEDPENPTDPENPEEPPIEDNKEKFNIDTLDELKEYQNRTIYDYFNDNYIQSVVTKLAGRSASVDNAEQIEWAITGTEGETITELQVRFVYHRDASYMYYVGTVVPTEAITVNDILTGNIQEISTLPAYSANTIEADMGKNQSLAEAIVTELGGTVNDSDQFLFAMDNATNDPDFSIARTIHVTQITDTGVNEYKITINAANATGSTIEAVLEQLQKNLEAGEYKNGAVEANVVTFAEGMDGSVANIPEDEWPEFEEEEAASTSSEAYRLYGKMKAKDGSSVNIYLPEDLMNELE